ncbi:7-dehydrocholesterol reductase [Beauveria bassiana ARSEF 2860]|uniref:7-dehydrocholesterol reductase n=1 Tax=Beauveria bassiana (strain ARSEF 2860) TaxID=655819 RepID=J4WC16_BEAB2|nr:7-dehydrocholesterol reductase [Beauveria bassiana ARSEF 2860]EJP67630.1 7-dehydrocholesterol reductase [Beauveria bassiana ARSEF 2860]
MYVHDNFSRSRLLLRELGCFILLVLCPVFVLFYWNTYNSFDASLAAAVLALVTERPLQFFLSRCPGPTTSSTYAYAGWLLLQAALYVYLPGPVAFTPRTPAGRRMPHTLNGFYAWICTMVLMATVVYVGSIDPAFIALNWAALLVTASAWSFLVIAVFQVKARLWPDDVGDTLLTGEIYMTAFHAAEMCLTWSI